MKHCIFVFLAAAQIFCAACSTVQPARERIQVNQRGLEIGAGSADAQFDKVFGVGPLEKRDVAVSYFPADDVVCLRFRVDLVGYRQYWDQANRAAFIEALDRYKEDYDQKNLPAKGSRGKRQYGTIRGLLIWETHRFSHLNYSYPKLELGYYFKNRSPYFTVTQREAPNEEPASKQGNPRSRNIVMYLTRAQADSIAALFAQDYLLNLRPGIPESDSSVPEADAYVEAAW